MSLRKKIVHIMKSNPYLFYLLVERRRRVSAKDFKKYDDYTAVIRGYERFTGMKPNLKDPKRLSEKHQWLKLFYRDDLLPIVTDKYLERQYVIDKGYGDLLPKLYGVYNSVDEVDLSKLPEKFVLKVTPGSGFNYICTDKSKFKWKIWKKIFNSWMHQNLYYFGREWNYKDTQPRIIAEEYLEDKSGDLKDIKVFCSYGKASYVQIDGYRYTDHRRQLFTRPDGEKLPMKLTYPRMFDDEFEFTDTHKQIVELAKEFSKPFPHIRMDFFVCNGEIKLGEFTFLNGAGNFNYKPDEYNFILGDDLTLPEPNYNLELYKKIQEGKM